MSGFDRPYIEGKCLLWHGHVNLVQTACCIKSKHVCGRHISRICGMCSACTLLLCDAGKRPSPFLPLGLRRCCAAEVRVHVCTQHQQLH